MRHASIKTTMDYYANVDDAVEEAVLGPLRSGLRNSAWAAAPEECKRSDATPFQDGSFR
jgi:hypothetical protein